MKITMTEERKSRVKDEIKRLKEYRGKFIPQFMNTSHPEIERVSNHIQKLEKMLTVTEITV